MGDSLKRLAGNKLKQILTKMTDNPVKGVLTGILITILLQSSSGSTSIVVALISAGLLTLPQGIAVIIGANIGKTITSLIIGLNVGNYSLIFIGIGLLIYLFIKREKLKSIGLILFGFGLIFFGLELMSSPMKIVVETDFFKQLVSTINNVPIIGLGIGTLITIIVQSSAATIGIMQKLYVSGATSLTLNAILPVVIGANIGTTITTIIASINLNKNAKRATIIHVMFNLIGAIVFMILLHPYIGLMQAIENGLFGGSFNATTIALAHVVFNVVTAIIFIPFINLLVKLIYKVIKPSESELMMSSIDRLKIDSLEKSPTFALENSHEVLIDLFDIVKNMYNIVSTYIFTNTNSYDEIVQLEETTDNYDNALHDYIAKLSTLNLTSSESKDQSIQYDTSRDLERIADHLNNLAGFMKERYENNYSFFEKSSNNLKNYLKLVGESLDNSYIAFKNYDHDSAMNVQKLEIVIDELEKTYRKDEVSINNDKLSDYYYIDILSNLERIADHCHNISDNILLNGLHTLYNKEKQITE